MDSRLINGRTILNGDLPSHRVAAPALLLVLICLPVTSAQERALSSRGEALKVMFRLSEKVVKVVRSPNLETRDRVAKRLGIRSLTQKEFVFYLGKTKGKTDGYALIMNEKGKFQPITFLVGIDSKGKVKMDGVVILKYREPIGGEVRHPQFTRQFQGKGAKDPIEVRKDIKNISGATISCRSVAFGVKKAVLLVDEMFLEPKRTKEAPQPQDPPKEKGKPDDSGEKGKQ